jgi:hypothetical protein
MLYETNKDKGRAGMALGIAYFGANGYTVNIPLNDTQWYDFVVEKDGVFQTVQCKATGSKDNAIMLKSNGGTNGGAYDSILNHPLDLLFCLDAQQNMFVIPVSAIREAGNTKQITLRTEVSKFANTTTFSSVPYLVTI